MSPISLDEIPTDVLPLKMEQKLACTIQSKRSSKSAREKAQAMLVMYAMCEAVLYAGRCCQGQFSTKMLVSLSYLALCKAAKNFKPGQLRFFSYGKIYVRSEVFRHFKVDGHVVKNAPVGPVELPEDEGTRRPGCVAPDSSPFDFDHIHSAEVWSALLPFLVKVLTPKEYHVITRHYIDDLNFREIGDELSASRSWAQILHTRALRKIRSHRETLRKVIEV